MEIRVDDLHGPEIVEFLRLHLEEMASASPPESMHALDIEALRRPEITFWSVWDGDEPIGCGALKELDEISGEIKSMRTDPSRLREGVARTLLAYILAEAERRGYREVSLETGSQERFAPARRLYASFGFVPCGPFADYVEDPNSVFMTRQLWPPGMATNSLPGLVW